jgi:hypothetical protein
MNSALTGSPSAMISEAKAALSGSRHPLVETLLDQMGDDPERARRKQASLGEAVVKHLDDRRGVGDHPVFGRLQDGNLVGARTRFEMLGIGVRRLRDEFERRPIEDQRGLKLAREQARCGAIEYVHDNLPRRCGGNTIPLRATLARRKRL